MERTHAAATRKISTAGTGFVMELTSPSDNLTDTQAKMQEYCENGVQLGWLLNRQAKQVELYRLGQAQ